MPQHFGVAVEVRDLFDDRVDGIFFEVPAISARRDALHRGVARCGIKQHERRPARLAQVAGILPINHGAAAPHWPHLSGRNGSPSSSQ